MPAPSSCHANSRLRRYLLAAEAAGFLLLAQLMIQVVPYKRLVWWFRREPTRILVADAVRQRALSDVRWAIAVAAHRLPGEVVCFPRAVAAQAMLRRRGVPTTLYYGAARGAGDSLLAHAWLQHQDEGVLGHEEASQYRVVARYPEPRGHELAQLSTPAEAP